MSLQAPPVALVADAVAGLGLAYAERLAHRGFDLMLVAGGAARLAGVVSRLRGVSGQRVEPVLADLSDPADQRRVVELLRGTPRMRVLVNNLAAADPTPLLLADPDRTARAIALHVAASARLAQAAASAFAAHGEGRIVNVAPAAPLEADAEGLQGAARAFVLTLSGSLRRELAGAGVRVRVMTASGASGPLRLTAPRLSGPGAAVRGYAFAAI